MFWDTAAKAIELAIQSVQTAQQELAALVADVQAQNILLQQQIARLTTSLVATSHADGVAIQGVAEGVTAKVTISAHTRIYTDDEVAVDGGELDGLEYAKAYSIYYDDPERDGGAVVYVATLDPTQSVTSATNPSRHYVGSVTTPATSGDPPTGGGGALPPGWNPREDYDIPPP